MAIDPDSDGAAEELGWFNGVQRAGALPRTSFAKRLAVTRHAIDFRGASVAPLPRARWSHQQDLIPHAFPRGVRPMVACDSNVAPGKYVFGVCL